jgi:hypothetical protein
MAEDVPLSLFNCAAVVSGVIRVATTERRIKPSEDCYPLASDIAVRLHLINEYLSSLPPYWIEPDIEELCRALFQELKDVTTPRPKAGFLAAWMPTFGRTQDPPTLEDNVLDFLRAEATKAQNLKITCDELVKRLTKDETDNDQREIPDRVSQFNAADMSAYFNGGVFDALQSLSECNPESHDISEETGQNPAELRHLTRLCLAESDSDIRVLVPNRNMEFWQEFCLRTQLESPVEEHPRFLERGGFCQILEREISARLIMSFKADRGFALLEDPEVLEQILQPGVGQPLTSVLRNYELTPKDKVLLAYAVARAYWQ